MSILIAGKQPLQPIKARRGHCLVVVEDEASDDGCKVVNYYDNDQEVLLNNGDQLSIVQIPDFVTEVFGINHIESAKVFIGEGNTLDVEFCRKVKYRLSSLNNFKYKVNATVLKVVSIA